MTGFDTTRTPRPTTITVDYGQYIAGLATGAAHETKQAVVLGTLDEDWKWGPDSPVHMVCHSQGGNTVRLLLELLSGDHGQRHPAYFSADMSDRRSHIKSMTSLGTPFLGTTITSVILDVSSHFTHMLLNYE